MLDWIYHTAERVDALAKTDPEFQELAEQRLYLEGDFTALLDRQVKMTGSCCWNTWTLWEICSTV